MERAHREVHINCLWLDKFPGTQEMDSVIQIARLGQEAVLWCESIGLTCLPCAAVPGHTGALTPLIQGSCVHQ